jgi:hypothetical protein
MVKKLMLPLLPVLFVGLALSLAEPSLGRAVADPAAVTPLPPVTDPDGRLGVCYAYYPDETAPHSGERPYLDLMYDAGARHDRWDFSWWVIQQGSQDEWNWGGHETLVEAENAKGMDVLGILEWTPQWASTYSGLMGWPQYLSSLAAADARFYAHTHNPLAPTGPRPFNSYPPKNLDRPVFVNGQINRDNYWGYFVYNVAKHFDGKTDPAFRVNAWEIWNEVEGDWFWSGSADDYCQLLQVAYKAIKGEGSATGGNPDATVLFAGLHYWADPDMYTQVLGCLAAADPGGAEHNYFFDVMSVHFYSRSDNTYDMVSLIESEMTARGMGDHPIWLTETGAPIYGDVWPGVPNLGKGDNYLDIDEEAAYVLQSYANALAAGVERYYFFRAHDADMGEPHGLIRNDKSLRPAYVAYQVAAQYLRGENQATRVIEGETTRVSLWGTPRGKISVLWNRTPNPVTYPQEAAMLTATLVDRWGVTQTVSAVNDVYSLTLPAATASLVSDPNDYIVGGDPLILIETDIVSPTSALAPLPSVNKGTPITLTWTASDTESGVWYTEIQVGPSPTGPWTTFAGWGQTQSVTQTVYYGEHDATFYFRARARDRVGNWELWPASFEVSTTVDADTELHWYVGTLFNDSNRNGEWDRIGTGSLKPEITLTHVSMRFVDEEWHVITSVISNSWRFTETLLPGTYTFVAEWEDDDGGGWIYYQSLILNGVVDPLYAPLSDIVGLLPWQDVYLPVVRRDDGVGQR